MDHSFHSITHDLQALGIMPSDMLFIHSSFKSLGPVAGGAETVVQALEAAVGSDGLILMPSFNLVAHEDRPKTWNWEETPSTVGWLTEFFRLMPGTYRSDHYSHSVAARGNGADRFVADHLSNEGYGSPWDKVPWGKTYGTHSPMVRAYERGGRLLMLGVDYETSTYIHLAEVIYWNELLEVDPEAPYLRLDRPKLGAFWDQTGDLRRGSVGQADCRCFGILAYVDRLLEEVRRDPGAYDRNRS